MEEICDVYNIEGRKTGKTVIRGNWHRQDGEYLQAVHILIRDKKGRFLVQKRSINKKSLPGRWNLTCGMVDSGEECIDAAVREIKEEIGIQVTPEDMTYGGKTAMKALIADIWLATADFELEDCVLQKDEVDDVKWVSGDEMINTVRSATTRSDEYMGIITRLVNCAN